MNDIILREIFEELNKRYHNHCRLMQGSVMLSLEFCHYFIWVNDGFIHCNFTNGGTILFSLDEPDCFKKLYEKIDSHEAGSRK